MSDQDAEKRRDEILKRMLQTPPQPKTTKDKSRKSKEARRPQPGREH